MTILGLIVGFVPMVALMSQPSVVRPGLLTQAHAQIITGGAAEQSCTMCHDEANSIAEWLGAVGTPHAGVKQTDRCLDCHHETIPRASARWAHNLSPQRRAEIANDSAGRDHTIRLAATRRPATAMLDPDSVQCNVCHREHHGADHSLTTLQNDQCQTCHGQTFDSFAHGHPEFDRYPYGITSTVIAFDHQSHAGKHFPQSSNPRLEFDCNQCHERTEYGEISRGVSFEKACRSCHDAPLRTAVADGVTLFELPILSRQQAERIGGWPESAIGFPEVTPVAFESLLGWRSPSSNRPPDPARLADEVRRFAYALADQGQIVGIDRLVASGVNRETAEQIWRAFSPQVLSDAVDRWFGDSPMDSPAGARDSRMGARARRPNDVGSRPQDSGSGSVGSDDLLDGGLLGNDPNTDSLLSGDLSGDGLLAADPLNDGIGDDLSHRDGLSGRSVQPVRRSSHDRFEATSMMPGGGWYRDDLTLAIRYRGGAHEDPMMRALIESIHQVADAQTAVDLSELPAVRACLDCHAGMDPARVGSDGMGGDPSWTDVPWVGRRDRSTKFSHRPHLNIASIADCRSCHQVDSANTVSAASTPSRLPCGLAPIDQAMCAGCHQARGAGDSCTTCHRYHISSPVGSDIESEIRPQVATDPATFRIDR